MDEADDPTPGRARAYRRAPGHRTVYRRLVALLGLIGGAVGLVAGLVASPALFGELGLVTFGLGGAALRLVGGAMVGAIGYWHWGWPMSTRTHSDRSLRLVCL